MVQGLLPVCALMGGVGYYRKFLYHLSKRIHPIPSLVRKRVTFDFTLVMATVVREILADLATPFILVFSNWHAVADGSSPIHVFCNFYSTLTT